MNPCGFYIYRLEHEIQKLKEKICEVDGAQRDHAGMLERKAAAADLPSSADKPHLMPLMDARYSALSMSCFHLM